MNKYNPEFAYPNTLDGLDKYINPQSPDALDDIGVAALRNQFFIDQDGSGFDAIDSLLAKYKRTIDLSKKEYPASKGIPRWMWLAGAGALVLWFVMRDNKKNKGVNGVLKGKTFDAGDLS